MTDYLTDEELDRLERALRQPFGPHWYHGGFVIDPHEAWLLIAAAREYARIREARAEADEIAAAGGYEEDGG